MCQSRLSKRGSKAVSIKDILPFRQTRFHLPENSTSTHNFPSQINASSHKPQKARSSNIITKMTTLFDPPLHPKPLRRVHSPPPSLWLQPYHPRQLFPIQNHNFSLAVGPSRSRIRWYDNVTLRHDQSTYNEAWKSYIALRSRQIVAILASCKWEGSLQLTREGR